MRRAVCPLWMSAGSLAVGLLACGAPPPARVARCEGEPSSASAGTEVAEVVVERDEATITVRAGECEAGWLPAGLVRDVPPEQTEELVDLVRGWLSGRSSAPSIEHRRGILFVKSQDDEGADPPYPSASAATSTRACGLTAGWLRDHLRATFAMATVTCDQNVCCIPGMEFVSDRAIVFRRATQDGAASWTIDSTYEVAEAALGEEHVAANRRYVAEELARGAAGTCPGEPPGVR